jgi:hypothetical protein
VNTASAQDADGSTPDLRHAAAELHNAGLCVLPVKADGTKAPDVRSWTPYKTTRSTPEEQDRWFNGARRTGIGVIYGAVSGNVEMIEFEGRAITEGLLDEVTEIMEGSGLGDVWASILGGWVTESPTGGRHYRARIDGAPVAGNTKLASRLAREDEYTDQERQRLAEKPDAKIVRVLIETRGEGGYGVVEPSHGTVHATGNPYQRIAGSPENIPVIDADLMDAVRDILRMVDAMPKEEKAKTAPRPTRPLAEGEVRPGDDYENKVDWTEILKGLFTPLFTRGSTTYWRREGKTRGLSATTGHAADRDRLYVFSTSTEFQAEVPYDKFAAYTHLHHGGDYKAAARELAGQGYGSKPPVRRLAPVPAPRPRYDEPPVDGANALQYDHDLEPDGEGFAPHIIRNRPTVNISNEADAIDALLDVMASHELPDLYRRSGGPCWVYEDEHGNPAVRQLGTDNLRAYFNDHVTTVTITNDPETKGPIEVRNPVMRQTCATILGRKDWPLPHLRGIVTSPVVRPDGSLITRPGYDKATGLYMHPRVPLRRLRPELTQDSIDRAKDLVLDTMLADFPWMAASDRAQYVGALLSPIIRPYVPGPTPLVIITATSAGSGKTLLKDVFKYLYGLGDTPWPENDAELRKALTAQLRDGGEPVIAMDNLPNGHIIKSPILSSLVTADVWRDRVLGSSEVVTMPNDRLWIVTGNNLRTGGDNARRALWVRIDPDCPNPDQRDNYKVGDLRPWLTKNASTVVAALVTLVRGWLAEDAPRQRTRMGDYSDWAGAIAGLLKYIGVPGWLVDRDNVATTDDETDEWSTLLEVWHDKLGSRTVTTGEVLAQLSEFVPRLNNGDLPPSNQLGSWLKTKQGRYYGTHKIVLVRDAHRRQNTWRVDVHRAGVRS